MEAFLELLIFLLLTRLFSEGAERLGQPASVGELAAGMGLAAAATLWGSTIPFLVHLTTSKTLEDVAQLAGNVVVGGLAFHMFHLYFSSSPFNHIRTFARKSFFSWSDNPTEPCSTSVPTIFNTKSVRFSFGIFGSIIQRQWDIISAIISGSMFTVHPSF